MTSEEYAKFIETIEGLGAARVQGWLKAFAELSGPGAELRDPVLGDVVIKPLTEEDIREWYEVVHAERAERDAKLDRFFEQQDAEEMREEMREARKLRLEKALSEKPGVSPLKRPWDVIAAATEIAIRTAKKRKPSVITEADIKKSLRLDSLAGELHIDRSTVQRLKKKHSDDAWRRLVACNIVLTIHVSNSA